MNENEAHSELFDAVGGLQGLRSVITTFYDSVFDDVMIGYLFWKADKTRLIEMEVQFAARMLGARDIQYEGRPLRKAHASHQILGGHFDRRLQLLREAMQTHAVPQAVRTVWIEHSEALRSVITDDQDSNCSHEAAQARLARLRSEGLLD